MASYALNMAFMAVVCFLVCLASNLFTLAGGVALVAMAITVAPTAAMVFVACQVWSTFWRAKGHVSTRAEAAANPLAQACTRVSGNQVGWWLQVASFTVRGLAALCVIATSVCIVMWFSTVGGSCILCWVLVAPSTWHPTTQQADWLFHWVEPTWLLERILQIGLSTEWTCIAATDDFNQQEGTGNSDGVQSSHTLEWSVKRQYTTQGDTNSILGNNSNSSKGSIAPCSLLDAIAATIGLDSSSSGGCMPAAESMWGSLMTLQAPQLLPAPSAAGLAHHGLMQHQPHYVRSEIRRIDSLSSGGSIGSLISFGSIDSLNSGGSSSSATSADAGEMVQQGAREMSPETAAAVKKSKAIAQAMAECMAQLRAMGHVQ